MKATKFRAAMLVGALAFSTAACAADPTLHEVYQAADAGRTKEAEAMMVQVLRNHPSSAKAHFVEAELLARGGRLDAAAEELGTAERLAPGLGFAKPEAVRALKQRLSQTSRGAPVGNSPAGTEASTGSSLPWGPLLAGLGLLAALAFFVRSLGRTRCATGPAGHPAAGTGPAGGYGGYGQPAGAGGVGPVGGVGSGILGGLATGAAVGAGIVAGEALMHRVFDGGSRAAPAGTQAFQPVDHPLEPASDYGMGGEDFGVRDAGGWDDGALGAGDDWN